MDDDDLMFAVYKQVADDGAVSFCVRWGDIVRDVLDEISPNYEWTDRIIDATEKLYEEIEETLEPAP